MKKQLSMLACGALLMASAAAVMAQSQRPHQDRGHNGQSQDHRGMHDRGRSEGWYKKGGHVPAEYRGGSYVVNDWHSRHLHQPPRGYHYVRSDNGDFLLVAITTGVIASILANH